MAKTFCWTTFQCYFPTFITVLAEVSYLVFCISWSFHGCLTCSLIKVAEHSFRARSCLRNSARAQILHKNKHGINSTIILFQFPRYLFYFCFTNEYNVLMVLLFYYKGMLEKVTMQRTQQFSAFVCYRKNPVKCSACVVSRKNCDWVKNWPLGDTHISREPLIRILRNLAQKYFRR